MKKLGILLGILSAILITGVASARLVDFYSEKGLPLPSVSDRASIAGSCNISNYVGSKTQNIVLEACLRGNTMLGAISRPEMFYSKNITRGLSLGGSETEIYVSALPNETTGYLIINPNSTDNRELIKYTGVTTTGGNQLTGVTRGLAEYGTTGSAISDARVTANVKRHSSGETIIMSNGRYEQNIIDVINGLQPTSANTFMVGDGLTSTDKYIYLWDGTATSTAIKWDYATNQLVFRRSGESVYRVMPTQLRGTYANFLALPSTGNSIGDIAITEDDNKLYTYATSSASWVLAGGSSGAGTVYKTEKLGSESDAGDLKTFTLTAGSWPDEKFLLVYKNGQAQRIGATYDYTEIDSNTIQFTTTLASDDLVQMIVVSVDLYNPAWGSVNDDIIPDTDNAYDIGNATHTFKSIYATSTVYTKYLNVNGVGATSTPTSNAMPIAKSNNLLDARWIASTTAATGSIIYYNGTDYQNLGVGTSLQLLGSNGTSPTYIQTPLKYASVSDTLQQSADTERSKQNSDSYTKVKEVLTLIPGVIRVKFSCKYSGSTQGYGKVYKNGSAIGTERSCGSTGYETFSEDFNFVAGDLIQIYYKNFNLDGSFVYVNNFRVYYTENTTTTYQIINTN